jgi:putative redox protein
MVDELKIVGTAVALNSVGAYKTSLKSREFNLVADEPLAVGGNDEGPSPSDYLCMSLAACKAITLRMYVQRKQWDAGEIDVQVKLVKADNTAGVVHTFMCEVTASGNLSIEQKEKLLQIEKACPISKLLSKGVEIVSVIK